MKNPLSFTSRLAFFAAAFASTHLAAAATTVFTDTFDSGTGSWYKAYTSAGTGLSNSSGQLSFNAGTVGDGLEVIGRSFSTQTLGVGETIRMSFDFKTSGAVGILRFGLYDRSESAITADDWANTSAGTYAGYTTFIRDNSASGNVARVENGPFTTASTNGYPTYGGTGFGNSVTSITNPSNTTSFDLDNTGAITYQFLFDITRTSLTQTDTLLTILEGATTRFSVAGRQTTGTTFNVFDTAVLRVDSNTVVFDNVKVSVIPEPSVAILGSLGVLALLRRRR